MIQIQPRYEQKTAWTAFAERQGLSFEALELSMPPLLNDKAKAEEVLEWYRQSQRVTAVHGAFIDINPASGDAEQQKLSRRRCEESCALAKALGATAVIFHCSCFPFLRGAYAEAWASTDGEFFSALADKWDLRVFLENSMDLDPTPLSLLMKKVDRDKVGICFDIGHANYSRVPLNQWFAVLGDTVEYFHLSDNCGDFDDHLPLGEGTVDWFAADAYWRSCGSPRFLTLETGSLAGTEKSLAFLRARGLFGMEKCADEL